MHSKLRIYDKQFGGEQRFCRELRLVANRMSVRKIIESRIAAEAADLLKKTKVQEALDRYLIEATANTETVLNGPDFVRRRRKNQNSGNDCSNQADVIVKAFEVGRLLVLIDNKQVTSVDQEISLRDDSSVTFIKLTPLVGG